MYVTHCPEIVNTCDMSYDNQAKDYKPNKIFQQVITMLHMYDKNLELYMQKTLFQSTFSII